MLTSTIASRACRCGATHVQRHYVCDCGWLALSYAGAVEHVALRHSMSMQQAEGAVQQAIIDSTRQQREEVKA